MWTGFYRLELTGQGFRSDRLLVLDDRKVLCLDSNCLVSNGSYVHDPATDLVSIKISLDFPPPLTAQIAGGNIVAEALAPLTLIFTFPLAGTPCPTFARSSAGAMIVTLKRLHLPRLSD
ncbi:MAG: hypothetical protein HOO00_03180 [Rhodospirillaceae bacterium]|jgi:hypothetical protein|nr:hypothetical protein [Rhodospirillaceae bacterium]MBT5375132.1 hypothetical protein [Rhodospirillaceae bacterium]MBT5659716.1 hypothetical protein [Rhodospirillaceae bacterium]MBT5752003.1 hypothetical protein [Rhodospirillaceae bacterium]